MAVNMKIMVLWHVTLCSFIVRHVPEDHKLGQSNENVGYVAIGRNVT
jgi:hypothetical protein